MPQTKTNSLSRWNLPTVITRLNRNRRSPRFAQQTQQTQQTQRTQRTQRTRQTRQTQRTREIRRCELASSNLSDQQIRDQAAKLRETETLKPANSRDRLNQLTGLIAESVYRTAGFRLHDVQIEAIVAASTGAIVEMQTGEGKTVVTGAIAALNAVSSPGIHVGTTNAYLAERDLESVHPMFGLLGLTAGLLPEENDNQATQQAYQQDITYGPGYQFGFDYLRDQVELRENRQSRLGQRTLNAIKGRDPNRHLKQPLEHHVALIDEADSVMIDEAVTPLVISGAASGKENPLPFNIAKTIAASLEKDVDFTLTLPEKQIEIEDDVLQRCHEAIANRRNLELARPWKVYINNALRAHHVLQRDVDYVVRNGEVLIVDQSTGRIFPDRNWQSGLHQAVEAKEEVEIKKAPGSVARITRQRYLQLYTQLAGLTGTAWGARHEFQSVYKCTVIPVPTNLACIRKNARARFFADQEAKLTAIATDVAMRVKTGQPILIGTRTIAESILVDEALTRKNISAVVLNGVQDQEEAEIVAAAGSYGAITIATNMAGRGTDIKLDSPALQAGGLHVIGFSPNGSPRIDRQLIGRAARQGKPGSSQFFVAADDEIIQTNAPALGKRIARRSPTGGEARTDFTNDILHMQLAIEASQCEMRQAMIRKDHWMDQVRESISRE